MQQNNTILFVRLEAFEQLPPQGTAFTQARLAYLQQMQGAGKTALDHNGEPVLLRYKFRGRKTVWSVKSAGATLQKARALPAGYEVATFNPAGETIKTEEYDEAQRWLGVRYLQNGVCRAQARRIPDGLLVERMLSEEKTPRQARLSPCPHVDPANEPLIAHLTRLYGPAQAAADTADGLLYFYPDEQAKAVEQTARAFCAPKENAVIITSPDGPTCLFTAPEKEAPAVSGYYAAGRYSAGKAETFAAEAAKPVQQEQAPVCTPEAPPPLPEEGRKRLFTLETGDRMVETDAAGNILHAGESRSGEAHGFGARVSIDEHMAFIGTWAYGSRAGLCVKALPSGEMQALFEDGQQASTRTGALFGAGGTLEYAGAVTKRGEREGFGFAALGEGRYYAGGWLHGSPHGQGILLDGQGILLYHGQWRCGKREGMGAEYRDGCEYYRGSWKNGRYEGEGRLTLPSGEVIVGSFLAGEPDGMVCEYAPGGAKQYEGGWKNGMRSGRGTLYLPGGARIEGEFQNGALCAGASLYDKTGALSYTGAFEGSTPCGKGVLYCGGKPVYEGELRGGAPGGTGKQLDKSGRIAYAGGFLEGKRHGLGAAFEDGSPLYFGQWANGEKNGCGVEYRAGKPVYAGGFLNGKRHGRGNEYSEGELLREAVFESGEPVYMLEYSKGRPVYVGSVYAGQRSGMGRLLNEWCECDVQGVFLEGRLSRPVQVMARAIDPLPCPEELVQTAYGALARPRERYVLEYPFAGGAYSGRLADGLPDGKGTLLYPGHCYCGQFCSGQPQGVGRLYLTTGEVVRAQFGEQEGAETLECDGRVYCFVRETEKHA